MREIFAAIIDILGESSPYLILGFALAGVLHVVLTRYPRITAQITGPGRRPVFMAALLGAPMPLCSCSVLPAAMALRRKGASKGATASFLVSVPETDIVSILVTFALIGPFVGVWLSLIAVQSARVGVASTLMAMTPVISLPLVHFLYHERVSPRAVAGTLVAMAGVAAMFLV